MKTYFQNLQSTLHTQGSIISSRKIHLLQHTEAFAEFIPSHHASQLLSQVTDSWLSDTCLLHAGHEFASCSMLHKNSPNAQVLEPQSRKGKTEASSSLLSYHPWKGEAQRWHRGPMIH